MVIADRLRGMQTEASCEYQLYVLVQVRELALEMVGHLWELGKIFFSCFDKKY